MITQFRDEWRWLSNFMPVEIQWQGRMYPSVEHAYQSAKSDEEAWKEYCSDILTPAGKVKKKSRFLTLRPDWLAIREEVMEMCLRQKYAQQPYMTLLINTGQVVIQEGNWWGDTFWGVDLLSGGGENRMGKLIMDIRQELQQSLYWTVTE